jgi:hypothetical protein
MKITTQRRDELNELAKANGGLLLARDVLDRARKKESALHAQFDWDKNRNAERGLLLQAQELIMAVKIKVEARDEKIISVRAYWSLASDRLSGGGYRPLSDVMNNQAWRDELLATALGELDALRKRYARLEELTAVFAAVVEVQRKTRHRSPKKRRAA